MPVDHGKEPGIEGQRYYRNESACDGDRKVEPGLLFEEYHKYWF
jgi:hypothetical protein